MSPRDTLIDDDVFQTAAHAVQIEKLLDVPLGIECSNLAFRILIVRDTGIETVRQKDHRSAALLFSDKVRIQLGLLAAFGDVYAGALGFNHSEDSPIVAEQYIIRIAYFRLVGHAGDLILVDPVLALDPAGVLQHGVDIQLARLIL